LKDGLAAHPQGRFVNRNTIFSTHPIKSRLD
jgi:hypothetical protein